MMHRNRSADLYSDTHASSSPETGFWQHVDDLKLISATRGWIVRMHHGGYMISAGGRDIVQGASFFCGAEHNSTLSAER